MVFVCNISVIQCSPITLGEVCEVQSDIHRLISIFPQVNFVRYGHQMSTRNKCIGPKPKYRGTKRRENEKVHGGETLVTQRIIRILPGMNVMRKYGIF